MISRTACSGSAVLSTIMAFNPPVSAISGASGAMLSAIVRLIRWAVAVDPVKHTPPMRASPVRTGPSTDPAPGNSCSACGARPPRASGARRHARKALLSLPVLPARHCPPPSAAAIWPVKIASGKFHGEMQVKIAACCRPVPRPRGLHSSAGNPPPRAVRQSHRVGVLPASRDRTANSSPKCCSYRSAARFSTSARAWASASHGLPHQSRLSASAAEQIAVCPTCRRDQQGLSAATRSCAARSTAAKRACLPLIGRGKGRARRIDHIKITASCRSKPLRIGPLRRIKRERVFDRRRTAASGTLAAPRTDRRPPPRAGHFVHDLVHKAGIRPVFQQTPHQIGQQIAMRAHRRIDAATGARFFHHHVMQTPHPCRASAGIQRMICRQPFQESRPRYGHYAWRIADRSGRSCPTAFAHSTDRTHPSPPCG
jgi:hypothetical protein